MNQLPFYKNYKEVEGLLKQGGVGVLKTDTLYGLVGSALSKEAIERIYEVKRRPSEKRIICLCASLSDIRNLGLHIQRELSSKLESLWPATISIDLPISTRTPEYLHRGYDSVGVRIPDKGNLLELLDSVGPLAAPSANISGEPPAKSIDEAVEYFGNKVDFYIDEGEAKAEASTIIGFNKDNGLEVFREGAVSREEIKNRIEDN